MATLPGESIRRVCRVLKFSRARLRARAVIAKVAPRLDEVLAGRLQRLIELYPTFGYRRLWALLRFGEGLLVNRKAVYRILKRQRLVRTSTCGDAAAARPGPSEPCATER
jgi:putative transposase